MTPSIFPIVDTATCMDNGSDSAAFAHDVEDMTGCAAPTTGALDAPSPDAAISYASSVDAVATLTPLALTTNAAPAVSWRVCRRRIFFGVSHRRVPRPPTLQETWRSVRGKTSLGQKDKKNS